jgi:phosphatidylserine decarboxylase
MGELFTARVYNRGVSTALHVRYRDRESGELLNERVFSERELRFFYGGALGRCLTRYVFSRGPFNSLYGRRQRARRSKGKIQGFVDRLGIDASEASRPLSDYATLDEFFCRTLRAGARPLDPDPDAFLSPTDGRILVFPDLQAGALLTVKHSTVALSQLVVDPDLAARYAGGCAVILRLAPADYHRFHFPADGLASASLTHGSRLHSVHPIALAAGAPSFRNKRAVSTLTSDRFGQLCIVEVGAMVVGTIVQTYAPGPVARGQEKGTFRFGGSTVVVLAEPGRLRFDPDLVDASADGLETFVKCGTRLGVRSE